MATYQQYFARFYIDSSRDDFIIGAVPITITNGYYFTAGYTGEGTNQFCEQVQADIRAEGTYASATVTYSATTGLITIATGGAAAALTFTDTALCYLFGFTGNRGAATSHVGTQIPRYVWRPTIGLSNYPLTLGNWWAPGSTSRMSKSPTGKVSGMQGNLYYQGYYAYTLLPEADVITPSAGTIYRDFETWWKDSIHTNALIRAYPDRTLNTSTSFKTGFIGKYDEDLGGITDSLERYLQEYNGFWNVNFEMFEDDGT